MASSRLPHAPGELGALIPEVAEDALYLGDSAPNLPAVRDHVDDRLRHTQRRMRRGRRGRRRRRRRRGRRTS